MTISTETQPKLYRLEYSPHLKKFLMNYPENTNRDLYETLIEEISEENVNEFAQYFRENYEDKHYSIAEMKVFFGEWVVG